MNDETRENSLFFRLNVFYGLLFGLGWYAIYLVPNISSHLPIGNIEKLLNYYSDDVFSNVEIHASQVAGEYDSLLWLVTAIVGAVVLMIPVTWTYLSVRRQKQMDQSLLQSMLILPIAVTGIVLIVHNSLALAFSLTGVVAAVRYRNTLKSTGDSLFIFLAVAVGLAAGIGMLIIAAVMTLVFNYTFLLLWKMNYGHRTDAKHYMRASPTKEVLGDDYENDSTG
jgi:hypothetical protein